MPTPGETGTNGPQVAVPKFLKEIVEETSRLARTSPHVNQASGVSVRMSIANYENLISNAERRALVARRSSGPSHGSATSSPWSAARAARSSST